MDGDSRRRSLKVVRVLCDGCERASASAYCTECKESACSSCAEQLHVRGRRASKRAPQRSCKGRSMKDLQKTVGVLALCAACRTRPAYRYSNGEVYALCQECRIASPEASAGHDVVKRAIAEELRRASKSSSSHGTSSGSSGSRRRSRHQHQSQHQHYKSRRERISSEDDSTGDDITDMTFSREGSTE